MIVACRQMVFPVSLGVQGEQEVNITSDPSITGQRTRQKVNRSVTFGEFAQYPSGVPREYRYPYYATKSCLWLSCSRGGVFFLYDSRHEYKKRVTTAHIFGDNLCNYLAVVTSDIHVHIG